MKIYSILVHPNKVSLNASLFAYANDYFALQGHIVKKLDLYAHSKELIESAAVMTNTVADEEKFNRSDVLHNFSTASKRNLPTAFIKEQLVNLKEADILYIQTPIWVWSIPSLLKLYVENTFMPNELFLQHKPASETEYKITPLMIGKKIIFSFTLGGSESMATYITGGRAQLFNPIKNMFGFVGYEWVDPHILWAVSEHDTIESKQEKYFTQFAQYLNELNLK